jgi:hypothetical protein
LEDTLAVEESNLLVGLDGLLFPVALSFTLLFHEEVEVVAKEVPVSTEESDGGVVWVW